MRQYLDLLQDILDNGVEKSDRTGTGTKSVFGRSLRFDLSKGFPLLTTKKIHIPSVVNELLWFLSGDTNVKTLQERGVTIWNEWADEDGELGPVYGFQWRHWRAFRFVPGHERYQDSGNWIDDAWEPYEIDQISNVITQIKENPDSRRHMVTAWNPADVDRMALPPCHYGFQLYVANGKLSLLFNMRSIDVFLGLPFNIASYAFLTHMIAQQCDLEVGDLIWNGGDTHLYLNHLEQAKEQLSREPRALPQLIINRKPPSIFEYKFEDFEITGYDPHPVIKAPIAV